MESSFAGFSPAALAFLRELKLNNTREWFKPRKHIYEAEVKGPMAELVLALGEGIAKFAPELSTDPKTAIYRIYRDTRFSPDKSPYKSHIAATFTPRGVAKHTGAGMYFHISGDEVMLAGGAYAPGSQELLAVRRHLAAQPAAFRSIVRGRQFRKLFSEMTGEKLKRVPKGFASDHAAADLLVYKQFLVMKLLPPDIATTRRLHRELLRHFQAMTPFLQFLNTPLLPRRRAAAKG